MGFVLLFEPSCRAYERLCSLHEPCIAITARRDRDMIPRVTITSRHVRDTSTRVTITNPRVRNITPHVDSPSPRLCREGRPRGCLCYSSAKVLTRDSSNPMILSRRILLLGLLLLAGGALRWRVAGEFHAPAGDGLEYHKLAH